MVSPLQLAKWRNNLLRTWILLLVLLHITWMCQQRDVDVPSLVDQQVSLYRPLASQSELAWQNKYFTH